jgi:hypothetical protein
MTPIPAILEREEEIMNRPMRMLGVGLLALALTLVQAGDSRVGGAEEKLFPTGGEFQVNTYTTSGQVNSKVAAWSGGFVVVWESAGTIAGQRYAADGTPAGGEFQINSYPGWAPDVTASAQGDIVVVWTSNCSSGTDSSSSSIQGQRYAADGTPAGGEFQINSYTTNDQQFPAVAAHSSGSFVVVWENIRPVPSYIVNIQAQRYAVDGLPLGGEFQVNSPGDVDFNPDVAVAGNGSFIVVWEPGICHHIQGQRYASDGSPLGGRFVVNTNNLGYVYLPAVAAGQDGDFVVIWNNFGW